jgi:hypothetical protein
MGLGICATCSGIAAFQINYNFENKEMHWIYINGAVFFTLFPAMEIAYRIYNKKSKAELKVDSGSESWSV